MSDSLLLLVLYGAGTVSLAGGVVDHEPTVVLVGVGFFVVAALQRIALALEAHRG